MDLNVLQTSCKKYQKETRNEVKCGDSLRGKKKKKRRGVGAEAIEMGRGSENGVIESAKRRVEG